MSVAHVVMSKSEGTFHRLCTANMSQRRAGVNIKYHHKSTRYEIRKVRETTPDSYSPSIHRCQKNIGHRRAYEVSELLIIFHMKPLLSMSINAGNNITMSQDHISWAMRRSLDFSANIQLIILYHTLMIIFCICSLANLHCINSWINLWNVPLKFRLSWFRIKQASWGGGGRYRLADWPKAFKRNRTFLPHN
jgi:hypothetical protein